MDSATEPSWGRRESWATVSARRAISLPPYATLGAVVLGGAPVWLLLTLSTDLALGHGRRLPRTRVLAFFAVYLGCELVGVLVATGLVANPHRLALRYVMKRELLWDPCLDIVGRRLPNAFVHRQGDRQEAETAAISSLATGLDTDSAVLIYPEGTRFSSAKHARAVEALRRRGHTALADVAARFRHVLPPKLGGSLALLAAAPGVDVVLLEHTGFEAAASFAQFWNGALVGQSIRVRLRRIPAADIPDEGQGRWLFDRWAEVDRWIDAA